MAYYNDNRSHAASALRLFLVARKTKVMHQMRMTLCRLPQLPCASVGRVCSSGFDIDIEQCPRCGGALKIIAAILERAAITKILNHLGLPARAPPRAPAQIFDPFEPT